MIHVLRYGFPLCSFTIYVPADWPVGHSHSPFPDEENQATCPDCKRHLECIRANEPEPEPRQLPLELTPMTEDEVRELLSVCLVGQLPWPTVQRMLATLAAWLPDRPK